ncbi:hypothetical protein LY76DRAFT_595985 [Colletotrichum caudatum]|nr:hypothetical protein LY76DRAFT_595985 [Colletotrichum caudatum]
MSTLGVDVRLAPVKSHKSIGMIETHIRLIMDLFTKKILSGAIPPDQWDEHVDSIINPVNSRWIQSIGFAPSEILMGMDSVSSLLSTSSQLPPD